MSGIYKSGQWYAGGESSGGGHTIYNNGTEMDQQPGLNFTDFDVSNDDPNEETDIAPHELTASEFNEIFAMLPSSVPAAANRGFTPVGTVITVLGTMAPMNYLECDGTVYPISSYPVLAAYFETQFGSKNYYGGDGTNTFAVPDLTVNTLTDAKFCVAFKNIYIETVPHEIYSAQERVVGEWIDGKPIYQKTWVGLSVSIPKFDWNNSVVSIDGLNIASLVNCVCLREGAGSTNVVYIPDEVGFNSNYLSIEGNSNATRVINAITIQYTKTTD